MMRTVGGVIVGAAVIVLVACGGSGSDGGEPSPSAAESPTLATVTASPSATRPCSFAPQLDIRVVDVATAEVTTVAPGHATSWSPDGERIAFIGTDSDCVEDWGIVVLNLATGATNVISDETAGIFRWSPDGRDIAFAAYEGDYPDVEGRIELVDVATGRSSELFRGGRVTALDWSADGGRLVFAWEGDDGTWAARVIDATTGVTVAEIKSEEERRIGGTVLSPAGGDIAFVTFEEDIKGNRIKSYLYVGPVDGESLMVLNTEMVLSAPAWSSDGATVAVSGADVQEFRLYTVGADGSGLQYVANGRAPSWAPDANVLAFIDDFCGRSDASVISPDGSGLLALAPELDGITTSVLWSPTGDRIAFVVEAGEDRGLYAVEPDGSGLKLIIDPPLINPSWSPDGSRLAGMPPGGRGFCY